MKSIFEKWNTFVEESQESSRLREIEYNTSLATRLFTLEEGDKEKSAAAANMIKNEQWEEHSPESFYASLTCNS